MARAPGRAGPGFYYVVIPSKPEDKMYQVYHPERSVRYEDLSFIRTVREILFHKAQAPCIDEYRKNLRKDLFDLSSEPQDNDREVRCGVREEKDRVEDALRKIGDDQLELLQSMTSLKGVTLVEPSKSPDKKGVFMFYTKSSDNPVNSRAIDLCWTAGLPPEEVRGTCILSRTEEVVEEFCRDATWRRCDFTLDDCASHAAWLQDARQRRVESGQKREDDSRWFANLADCEAPMPGGAIDGAVWKQSDDEIDICFDAGPFAGIRATRRDINVQYTKRTLFVRLRGRVLCNAELAGEVDPQGCCWTFDRDRYALQVTLCKSRAMAWERLIRREVPGKGHGHKEVQSNFPACAAVECGGRRSKSLLIGRRQGFAEGRRGTCMKFVVCICILFCVVLQLQPLLEKFSVQCTASTSDQGVAASKPFCGWP
ncbi:unnamed protein product [Symbiodinium microadriaticum]|nr:unnamed protein product [Symbiodinium sp. KB8]CAE7882999.1 unnamed protein product [Symbiodinium microadriaticum]